MRGLGHTSRAGKWQWLLGRPGERNDRTALHPHAADLTAPNRHGREIDTVQPAGLRPVVRLEMAQKWRRIASLRILSIARWSIATPLVEAALDWLLHCEDSRRAPQALRFVFRSTETVSVSYTIVDAAQNERVYLRRGGEIWQRDLQHAFVWSGTDTAGRVAGDGIYQLSVDGQVHSGGAVTDLPPFDIQFEYRPVAIASGKATR